MKRILGVIGGALVVCAVLVAVIIGAVFFFTQDVAVAGDAFMQAVKDEQFEEAYAMLGAEAQSDVDLDAFTETWAGLESWSFSSRSIDNNLGQVSGTAQFTSGSFNVVLVLEKTGDNWQIIGYSFPQDASTED